MSGCGTPFTNFTEHLLIFLQKNFQQFRRSRFSIFAETLSVVLQKNSHNNLLVFICKTYLSSFTEQLTIFFWDHLPVFLRISFSKFAEHLAICLQIAYSIVELRYWDNEAFYYRFHSPNKVRVAKRLKDFKELEKIRKISALVGDRA